MKKAYAVIGAAYGDEGKGLFTDYFSYHLKDSCVVRYNGGAQAGHTVTTPEGKRHVFGSLGSGSFNNVPTHLSSYYVFNPLCFEKESKQFKLQHSKNIDISIHENAYVSTPFDMIINQLVEKKRGVNQHGSCGLGFGETIQRCENENYRLLANMLKDKNILLTQLKRIQTSYFLRRSKELDIEKIVKSEFGFVLEPSFIEKVQLDYERIANDIKLTTNDFPNVKHIIFEGAQGLLLDQDIGYFPHVTRSNTGLTNIVELVKRNNFEELNVLYATRCYTTRHGAGPLKNELNHLPYPNIVDKTNIHNDYQGTIRYAYLDLDILKQTIEKDIEQSKIKDLIDLKVNYKIGLTCLDQTQIIKFYQDNQLRCLPTKDFIAYLEDYLNKEVLTSWGPTRQTIQ